MTGKRFSIATMVVIALVVGTGGFVVGLNSVQLLENRAVSGNKELSEDLDYESIEDIYDELRSNYDGELDPEALIEGAERGLVDAVGDPFTEYLSEEAASEFESSLNGEFSGIGAEVGIRNDRLVIVAPLPGTPAEQAGLRPGDHIALIDDEDSSQFTLDQAVARIRGDEGTKVVLTVVREDSSVEEIPITRAKIEVPSVTVGLLEGESIAHVRLSRFGPDTTADFKRELQSLNDKGIEKIVLDMRNNPGGLLSSAIDISSQFLDSSKTVVEVKRGERTTDLERAHTGGLMLDADIVVLINEGSASASEIVAGALQDNDVATVIGETSFGKGSVQELVDLGDGSLLKVTTHRWFTPDGRSISEQGIEPNQTVELTLEDINADRDPQLDAAIESLR